MKGFIKNSSYIPLIIIIILFSLAAIITIKSVLGKFGNISSPLSTDQRYDVRKPKAQQTLNKKLTFPINDQNGKEVSKFTYEIQNAEMRDEIVVKGQRASAIKGRTFLIFNLKITNNYDKSISLNARDYIRVIVDNSNEKLAPDIHNDPVEVQAISTKYTRLGLPVGENVKSIVLQVGEVKGDKETIRLNLR